MMMVSLASICFRSLCHLIRNRRMMSADSDSVMAWRWRWRWSWRLRVGSSELRAESRELGAWPLNEVELPLTILVSAYALTSLACYLHAPCPVPVPVPVPVRVPLGRGHCCNYFVLAFCGTSRQFARRAGSRAGKWAGLGSSESQQLQLISQLLLPLQILCNATLIVGSNRLPETRGPRTLRAEHAHPIRSHPIPIRANPFPYGSERSGAEPKCCTSHVACCPEDSANCSLMWRLLYHWSCPAQNTRFLHWSVEGQQRKEGISELWGLRTFGMSLNQCTSDPVCSFPKKMLILVRVSFGLKLILSLELARIGSKYWKMLKT